MAALRSALLGALVCAAGVVVPAIAQTVPAAYVYVSSTPKNSSVNEIVAYAADAKGHLTPVAGSPFTADVTTMAVNGLYLFGADTNNIDVDSYAIEANGSLRLVNQSNVVSGNQKECGFAGPLFLDHTGQSLYEMQYDGNTCANNQYASFGVVKSNGALTRLGTSNYDRWLYQAATFIGNDKYAYSVACNGNMYWEITGVQRNSNGALGPIPNFSYTLPKPKTGDLYCPAQVAADPTNHLAMVLQPVNNSSFNTDGGPQIGSFTVNSNGDLATTNTQRSMPIAAVGTATSISMSPSGELVAVGGTKGLQLFHFNGANAPTAASGVLTPSEIDQMFWDNDNHLYAISRSAGKLYVFTATATAHAPAPGQPYTIAAPNNLIVQPWPLPWSE